MNNVKTVRMKEKDAESKEAKCCSHKTGHVLSFQGKHKYQLLEPSFNYFSPESLPFSTNTDSFSFQNIFLSLSLQPNTSFPFLKENCDDALKSEDSGDRSSNPRVCRNLTISVVASSQLSNPSLCFNGSSLSLSLWFTNCTHKY